jgi:DNA-binding response OmpR family regulator
MNAPARILIVDDEPNVRLVFRTTLESAGYAITEAPDGAAALRALEGRSINLVLLDLRMPSPGGGEVLRRLREAGDPVPVVVITAHGSVPDAVAAMKLGALDFLSKPVAPDALRAVVAEVLRRHAAGDEPPRPDAQGVVTAASQFAWNMTRAKRALNLRRFEEAEVHLKQALALDTRSAEGHNLLGVVYEMRNQEDACFEEYRAALEADPAYGPARHNIQRFNERFTFGSSPTPVDLGPATDRPGGRR